jgi:hypothetical protein
MFSFKGARKDCRHCLGRPAESVVRQQTDGGSGQTAYGVGAQTAYGVGAQTAYGVGAQTAYGVDAQPLPVIKFPPPSQPAHSQVNHCDKMRGLSSEPVFFDRF